MLNAELYIPRHVSKVWGYFLDTKNWKDWHGSGIVELNPGWEEGAEIKTTEGSTGTVTQVDNQKCLKIEFPGMKYYFRFEDYMNNGTNLKWSISEMAEGFYPDKGAGRERGMLASLNKAVYFIEVKYPEEQSAENKTDIPEIKEKFPEKDKSGCFIATAVYGAESQQVEFLRGYRDEQLSTTFFGRLFIKIYYAISPHTVKYIKRHEIVSKNVKKVLDRIIAKIG